jgi:hypothetical protein
MPLGSAVDWEFSNQWGYREVINSPDLKAIIQEAVDNYSFFNNEYLWLTVRDNGSETGAFRSIYAYDDNISRSTSLYIEYTDGYITAHTIRKILRPISDFSHSQYAAKVPDVGDFYTKVNEVIPDEDNTYLRARSTGQTFSVLFGFSPLILPDDAVIFSVDLVCRARRQYSSYSYYADGYIRLGDTDYRVDNTDQSVLNTIYEYRKAVLKVKPTDQSRWQLSDVASGLVAGMYISAGSSFGYALATQFFVEIWAWRLGGFQKPSSSIKKQLLAAGVL